MIRFILGAFVLACGTVWASARPPAPAPALPAEARNLPMHFEWRREGPSEACGTQCKLWISAIGTITADTPREFESFAQGRDVRGATIVLDSEGGSVLGSLALGRLIRRHNMVTTVGRTLLLPSTDGRDVRATLSPRADCESMCTFVLLAGARRFVPAEARVLVHQIWLGDRREDATAASYSAEDLVLVQRDIGKLAQYTVEMGGAIDLLEMALRIPPWEPMRVLTSEELRSMRLHTVEAPIEQPSVQHVAVANPSPSTTGSIASVGTTDRGWSIVDRSGMLMLVRRHPLTVEGEEIGRFDVMFSCGDTTDSYAVTYVERRKMRGQRNGEPLRDISVSMGQKTAALKISSSDAAARAVDLSTVARGSLPAAAVKSFADTANRSLTITTTSRANVTTTIRVGNTGIGRSLAQLATSCVKKTVAATAN
jgi:hypothetical protein